MTNVSNLGIAKSLDRGLSLIVEEGTWTYIARMDADDVCHPERIARQVDRMEEAPEIDVLGTAVEIFGMGKGEGKGEQQVKTHKRRKIIVHPLKHELIEWNAWFFCPIAHPSVMFRTCSIASFKYDMVEDHQQETARIGQRKTSTSSCAEDYALWFRMLSTTAQKGVGKIEEIAEVEVEVDDDGITMSSAVVTSFITSSDQVKKSHAVTFENLASPLLLLRKHDGNVSRVKREKQNRDAHRVVLASLRGRLDSDNKRSDSIQSLDDLDEILGIALVACLQRPETSPSWEITERAAAVLLALEKISLRRINTESKQHMRESMSQRIVQDTTARLGAMAMIAVQKYGNANLISLWQGRGKN